MISNAKLEFYNSFASYIHALECMLEGEQQKLDALYENNPESMEKALSISQANAMNLENLEKKRIQLQREADLEGLTFSEVIADADEEYSSILNRQFERAKQLLKQIKYLNSRSMNISTTNLKLIGVPTEHISSEDSLDVRLAKKGYTLH